tara:strand:- start:780 stop:1853 length:1074 start_codon:yes stop_codon:yes gene_type:complete
MIFKNYNQELTTPDSQLDLVKKVVIVDGMIGGGKNLISSIVSSLPNIEMWLHKPNIEQICVLHYQGHITLDATKTLIKTWMEEEIYNQSMSRNTNFKPSDYSSVFYDARPMRYFKRLFKSPLKAIESIKKEMPTLNIMTHVNTSYAKPLFDALGERLIYIRFVRHPMSTYMIKHNANWTKRWETGGRHGYMLYKTIDQNSKSINLPFFVKDFEKNYLNSNSTERAILLFEQWIRSGDDFIDKVNKSTKATIFEIPFEKFVFDPQMYINKIALSLGVKPDNKTNKMIRKQGVPRSSLTDAPKSKVYSNLGWKSPKKKFTLAKNFAQGRAYAAETASPEALSILDKLAKDYEERHDLNI